MKNEKDASKSPLLAWCGWRLRLPEDWRPLRLEGGWKAGRLMIGDATEAILKVAWARVPPARARAAWERRIRRAARERRTPVPRGFTECALLRPRKSAQAIWSGCAEPAGLLLEVVYSAAADASRRGRVENQVLPSLAAEAPEGVSGTCWSIFGAAFVAPSGWVLLGQSLHLGQISLRFARGKDRLSVGQVYPAGLALARRPLGFWLRSWPWEQKTLRRFRAAGDAQPWRLPCDGGEHAGLLRRGRKRIRWPLGFLAPRNVASAAVVDGTRGRILRAEIESPREGDESILRVAVLGMCRNV